MLTARSKDRFPSLAGPVCPWHDDCTPMDCENYRTVPLLPGEGRRQAVSTGNQKAVPTKPSKRRKR